MKFKSEEERLNHPQAGKIPKALWDDPSYFNKELDETNIHFFTTPLEHIFKETNKHLTTNERWCAFIGMLIQSNALNLDKILNYATNSLELPLNELFQCIFQLNNNKIVIATRDYIKTFHNQSLAKQALGRAILDAMALGDYERIQWIQQEGTRAFRKLVFADVLLYAVLNGHFEMIKWIHKEEPDLIIDVNNLENNKILCIAAGQGHLDILKWLNALNPEKMSVKNFRSAVHNPMNRIIENGYLAMLQWLNEEAPEVVQSWLVYSDNKALSDSARYGHYEQFRWIAEQKSDCIDKMLRHRNYETFHYAAFSGNIDIMDLICKILPDDIDKMLEIDNFEAFRLALLYSPLNTLLWFENLRPKLLNQMLEHHCLTGIVHNSNVEVKQWVINKLGSKRISELLINDNYAIARKIRSLATLQSLQDAAPDQMIDLIKADNYVILHTATIYGYVDILEWLKKQVQKEFIISMIRESNFKPFRNAVKNNQLEAMQWLAELDPNLKLEMLNSYYSPYYYGSYPEKDFNLEVHQWLQKQEPQLFESAMTDKRHFNFFEHLENAIIYGKHSKLNYFLFSSPGFFARSSEKFGETTITGYNLSIFVDDKLQELHSKERNFIKKHPEKIFDITDKLEAKLCFNIIKHLISRNNPSYKKEVEFLSNIPSVKELLENKVLLNDNIETHVDTTLSSTQLGIFQKKPQNSEEEKISNKIVFN